MVTQGDLVTPPLFIEIIINVCVTNQLFGNFNASQARIWINHAALSYHTVAKLETMGAFLIPAYCS